MNIIIKQLGITDYSDTFEAMKVFTAERDQETPDELWVTEHNQIFTQGQAGKSEHLIQQTEIPVIQSDRGGQITYHGPGQIVLYTLVDIKRANIGIRQMITLIEESIIETLSEFNILANAKPDAPGVYVDNKKIASLGLRVRQGRTYHGLALNVDMDLKPFQFINPCGYRGLQMAQMSDFTDNYDYQDISHRLAFHIREKLVLLY